MAPEAVLLRGLSGRRPGDLARSWAIRRSRFGAGLLSIREDEDTARMLGVPTERYKRARLRHQRRADRSARRHLRPRAGLYDDELGLS